MIGAGRGAAVGWNRLARLTDRDEGVTPDLQGLESISHLRGLLLRGSPLTTDGDRPV